ncbi:MAG: FRG domain-containing protein [Roseateles sp.]|uniref:FRG domain-containing protein n=1 Tax=Roseateles sp. TaxID=1971397 RepID=UPI004036D47B
MKQIQISSVAQLLELLNSLPNNYLFRGHADADWELQSSLERVLGNEWTSENARKFEDLSLERFKSKFHLYDKENVQPTSKLAWLSLMQHYGIPTRLIDFTESPYVALYFALESYQYPSGKALSIYSLDYSAILKNSAAHIKSKDHGFDESSFSLWSRQDDIFDNTVDRFSYDIAWVTEPKLLNVRLDRQAGTFLLSGNRNMKIGEILGSSLYKDVDMNKIEIPSELAPGLFALLRKMNITSKSIYGDLGGLAMAIKMEMQVYALPR